MATEADANRTIMILRNITHLRDLVFEGSTLSASDPSRDPEPTLGRVVRDRLANLLTSARPDIVREVQQPRQATTALGLSSPTGTISVPDHCTPIHHALELIALAQTDRLR